MKIIRIVFVLATLFCAASSHAAGQRMMVIPFEDQTGELRGIEQDLTAAAIEEVKASNLYTYVSPEQYAENWMKQVKEGERNLFGDDMAAELKDLTRLRPMFAHNELGAVSEHRGRWGVDLVIVGEIRKEGGVLTLTTELISMETGRFYAVSGECKPGMMQDEAKRQAQLLMAKGDAVRELKADRRLDPVMSVVAYDITATDSGDLWLVADYTARRPDPELQNMDITPKEPLRDGVKTLTVLSKEGRPVEFQYLYKEGQNASVNITAPPPPSTEEEFTEVLSVQSKGGHVINFTLAWKRGELKGVSAEPAVNPFGEVK